MIERQDFINDLAAWQDWSESDTCGSSIYLYQSEICFVDDSISFWVVRPFMCQRLESFPTYARLFSNAVRLGLVLMREELRHD